MRTEHKNKKMLKKDKIRSEILCRRARLSKRMGEKIFDLQQSEVDLKTVIKAS